MDRSKMDRSNRPIGLNMTAPTLEGLNQKFPPFTHVNANGVKQSIDWNAPADIILSHFEPIFERLSDLFVAESTVNIIDDTTMVTWPEINLMDKNPSLKTDMKALYGFIHYLDSIRSLLLTHPDNYSQLFPYDAASGGSPKEFLSPNKDQAWKSFRSLYKTFGLPFDKTHPIFADTDDSQNSSPNNKSNDTDMEVDSDNAVNDDLFAALRTKYLVSKKLRNNKVQSTHFILSRYCANEVMAVPTVEIYEKRNAQEVRASENDGVVNDMFSEDSIKNQIIMDDFQILELALLALGYTKGQDSAQKRGNDENSARPNKRQRKAPVKKRTREDNEEEKPDKKAKKDDPTPIIIKKEGEKEIKKETPTQQKGLVIDLVDDDSDPMDAEEEEKEKSAEESEKLLSSDDDNLFDFTDMSIGSSIEEKLKRATADQSKTIVQFYRVYYFLTSLYYYCTEMWNILHLASHVHSRVMAKKDVSFLEKRLDTFNKVRIYYNIHVNGFLFRYYDINAGISKENKAVRTLLLTGENSDMNYANYRDSVISLQDKRILENPTLAKHRTYGLNHHIWSNLGKMNPKASEPDKRNYASLFMPYAACSIFSKVDINPEAMSLTKPENYQPKFVLRGNSPVFRSIVGVYFRQFITLLSLDNPASILKLSDSDYNEAMDTIIRATLLVNKGVNLVDAKTDQNSKKSAYHYEIMKSIAKARGSKNEEEDDGEVKSDDMDDDEVVLHDEEDPTPDEKTKKGKKSKKPEPKKQDPLRTYDILAWITNLYYDNLKPTEVGSIQLAVPHFMVLDGHLLRQPRVQAEWMQMVQEPFKRVMLMHMTETAMFLFFRKTNKSNVRTLFEAQAQTLSKLNKEKTTLILHASDLSVLPQSLVQRFDETILSNIGRLIIDRPLTTLPKRLSSSHHPTINIGDDCRMDVIQFTNLVRREKPTLEFAPIQKLHFRSINKHSLILDFQQALHDMDKFSNEELESALDGFVRESLVNETPLMLNLVPRYRSSTLEDTAASMMPSSFDNNSLADPINSVSRWWWNAHLWNHAYDVTLIRKGNQDAMDIDEPDGVAQDEQLIIHSIEDLREVNIKNDLLASIPYLGKFLKSPKNYLAHKDFKNVQEDIKHGHYLLDFNKETPKPGNVNFKLKFSPSANNDDSDVERINDFKLYRIATEVLNWVTDPTSMLTNALEPGVRIDQISYFPSVLTNGLSLCSFSYNQRKTEMQPIEFLKGSHVTTDSNLTPMNAISGDSIYFTCRKAILPHIKVQKEMNWMANVCALKDPKVWSEFGESMSKTENYNHVGEYAHTFFGFSGLVLCFSNNGINMRKSVMLQEKQKTRFTEQGRQDILDAKEKGVESISSIISVHKKDADGKKMYLKGKPVMEDQVIMEDVNRLYEELRLIEKTNENTISMMPLNSQIMLLDLFDVDRMDMRGVRLYHEKLPNVVGKPMNRHAIYYSDALLRNSDIVVPDLPRNNETLLPFANEKRILLMTVWPDDQTDFVVRVSLDAVFTLIALTTLQIPISPLEVLKTFKADEIKRTATKDSLYTPFIQFPSLGNIHVYDHVKPVSILNVEGKKENFQVPLGRVQNAYSVLKPRVQSLENIITNSEETSDALLFHRIYDVLNSKDSIMDAKLDKRSKSEKYRDLSELELILDTIVKEDAIWSSFPAEYIGMHQRYLTSDFTLENLWRIQCNTDFLERPISMLGTTTVQNKQNTEEKETVIFTDEEQITYFLRQMATPQKLLPLDAGPNSQGKEEEQKSEKILRRDLSLLMDTWAFAPEIEQLSDEEVASKAESAPIGLSESEKSDRMNVNMNFSVVAEHHLTDAMKMHDSILYTNLCAISMMVLREKFPYNEKSLRENQEARQNNENVPSLWFRLANWFCDEFYPIHFAYQTPSDIYEGSSYRWYDEKENILADQTYEEAEETKEEEKEKAGDDEGDIELDSTRKRRIGAEINESQIPIYLNDTLGFEINKRKFFWLYDYHQRSNTLVTFLKTMGLGEDDDFDTVPEDKDIKSKKIETNLVAKQGFGRMRDNFIMLFSNGDYRKDVFNWPYAGFEEEEETIQGLQNKRMQKDYNDAVQNGISEIAVTRLAASKSVLLEYRLFKYPDPTKQDLAMRINNPKGRIYTFRPYYYVPLSNQEDKEFEFVLNSNSATTIKSKPLKFSLKDERLLDELIQKGVSVEPAVSGITITEVVEEDGEEKPMQKTNPNLDNQKQRQEPNPSPNINPGPSLKFKLPRFKQEPNQSPQRARSPSPDRNKPSSSGNQRNQKSPSPNRMDVVVPPQRSPSVDRSKQPNPPPVKQKSPSPQRVLVPIQIIKYDQQARLDTSDDVKLLLNHFVEIFKIFEQQAGMPTLFSRYFAGLMERTDSLDFINYLFKQIFEVLYEQTFDFKWTQNFYNAITDPKHKPIDDDQADIMKEFQAIKAQYPESYMEAIEFLDNNNWPQFLRQNSIFFYAYILSQKANQFYVNHQEDTDTSIQQGEAGGFLGLQLPIMIIRLRAVITILEQTLMTYQRNLIDKGTDESMDLADKLIEDSAKLFAAKDKLNRLADSFLKLLPDAIPNMVASVERIFKKDDLEKKRKEEERTRILEEARKEEEKRIRLEQRKAELLKKQAALKKQ